MLKSDGKNNWREWRLAAIVFLKLPQQIKRRSPEILHETVNERAIKVIKHLIDFLWKFQSHSIKVQAQRTI